MTRFAVVTVLAFLLTACPGTQNPVTDIAGTWTGLVGDLSSDDNKSLLTVNFVQTGNALGGTATLGPVPYDMSGELTGTLEGDAIMFSFSFLSEVDDNGEVTTFKTTYSFTGEVTGDALQGDVVSVAEGIDGETTGQFELTRD